MRRVTRGTPGLLLAMLLLFARLLGPAVAMPLGPAGSVDPLSVAVICHTGAPGEAPSSPSGHADGQECLLCPACHLAAQAALPTPTSPGLPLPSPALIGIGAVLPPPTGPPSRVQTTAQPTGPPRFSA